MSANTNKTSFKGERNVLKSFREIQGKAETSLFRNRETLVKKILEMGIIN